MIKHFTLFKDDQKLSVIVMLVAIMIAMIMPIQNVQALGNNYLGVQEDELDTIIVDDAVTGTGENQYEFVGSWGNSTPATAYLQTDHYAADTDAYYQVRFTGTQVKVYGEKNNAFGIVAISIDGGAETMVDCYSAEKVGNTLLYKSPVLSDVSHTVKVRLTGTKNEASAGTWHTADRMVITPIVPETNTIDDAVTGTGENQYEFVGSWGNSTPATAYLQTDHYAADTDAYYQVRFTGTQVKVYGEKNNAFGIVAISIDGGAETMVDCYSAEKVGNTLLYKSPVLSDVSHTVKVRLTGTKNEASAGTWHTADRMVITPIVPETNTIDDAVTGTGENQYEFVGSWGNSTPATAYLQTDHYAADTDAYYQVRFTGTQVKVYGEKNNAFGIVAISIDGGAETMVDCYSAEKVGNTLLYKSPVLSDVSHTVKVRLTGTKNEASAGTWHTADRMVITPIVPETNTIDDAVTGTGENQYEFVGSWGNSTPATAYLQTDHYAADTDAYYQVRFTGTQVKVYGEKNNAFGIVAISIDGGAETMVDCYSAEKVGNTLLYKSPVLSDVSHTVKVRLTGTKNEASAGTWHTADRMVITPIVPETNTIDDAVTGTGENQYEFVGSWGNSTPATAYLQTDHYAADTDAYYQVRFTGTQVKVYGEKNNAFGIVAISIDGGAETMVDCYSAEKVGNTLLYKSPVLSDVSHTVKVRLTGTKNEASAGTWHTADRMVITPIVPETNTIDDAVTGTGENQYEFVGSWGNSTPATAYLQTDHYAADTDAYYQVRFTGTQVKVYGEKNNAFGIVAISIDGGAETMVDCYSAEKVGNTLLYKSPVLSDVSHTVKVRLTGTKNEASAGTWHTADRMVITPIVPETNTIDDAVTGTGENQYEFVGSWGNSTPATAYLQTDHYAADTDAYYQVRFTGTQVKVYGEKNNAFGIVAISIDGGAETMVDCYSAEKVGNTLLYKSPVLSDVSHTVKVRLTGTKNEASAGTWHTADRMVITPIVPETNTIDDAVTGTGENQYEFVGSWGNSTPATAYLQTDHYAADTDAYYQVRFTGTQVKVYGEKNNAFGIVAISIDGGAETMVDCYSAEKVGNTLLYKSPVLSDVSHTVKVRLTGTKNEASAGTWHTADRMVITEGTTGIEDIQNQNECIVYPNPSNGRFIVKSNSALKTIEIHSASGSKVFMLNNINQDNQEINISGVPNGIYFIKLYDGNNNYTKKVIIR